MEANTKIVISKLKLPNMQMSRNALNDFMLNQFTVSGKNHGFQKQKLVIHAKIADRMSVKIAKLTA